MNFYFWQNYIASSKSFDRTVGSPNFGSVLYRTSVFFVFWKAFNVPYRDPYLIWKREYRFEKRFYISVFSEREAYRIRNKHVSHTFYEHNSYRYNILGPFPFLFYFIKSCTRFYVFYHIKRKTVKKFHGSIRGQE